MRGLPGASFSTKAHKLAPLPQNNTNRLFIDYVSQTGGIPHTFAMRYEDSLTLTGALGAAYSFLDAIGESHFATGWSVQAVRVQGEGAGFSLPITPSTDLAGFVGTGGALERSQEAREFTFVGRSPYSGRRCKLSLFGIQGVALTTSYRVELPDASYPWLQDGVDVINTVAAAFIAIDGTQPVYYNYVNWQYNSHWEGELR